MITASTDAKFVRKSRARLGLSQTAFGERLGVSKRTIIRWEQGTQLTRRDRVAISLLVAHPRASKRIA
jgi:DNA-binding transcriptional regulator YiaG